MKKFLVFITTLFIIFSLSSCKKNNEFKIDGEYIYQIVKMATGGVIETVSIERIDDKKEKNK